MHVDQSTFEQVVSAHYESLYRFALSLTHQEADACDLTQETYRRFAEKGHQVRDRRKIKTWLFTTLYRAFVDASQQAARFETLDADLTEATPAPVPPVAEKIDGAAARDALWQLEDPFRAPLVLFYLEEHSYKEIAEILHVPIGTVMSRISRGRDLLRGKLEDSRQAAEGAVPSAAPHEPSVVP